MIKKALNLLNNVSGLHQTAYLLAFFAFLSQLLALLRDRLLAHSFGAGELLDIYYASFRIPDFIFVAIASIVSLSVLVPFLAEEMNKKSEGRLMSEIFSVFLFLIVIVCAVAFFLIPKITPLILVGFSTEALNQVIDLSRILLLSPILLGLSNFFTSIIQVNQKFFIYALSPLLYNIGIIIGIIFLYPVWGLRGLVLGVILGAVLHLVIQLPSICHLRAFPKIIFVSHIKKIKEIIALSLPRTLALSTSNLALIFLVGLASTIGEGAVSIFTFSFSIQSVPLTIIGVSYSIAAFPVLAKLFSNNQIDDFFQHITVVARHIVFWTTVSLVLFIVLRAQIIRTILGSGKFDWVDTRLTAACLAAFSLSVTAQSLVLLFIRGYYAAGKTLRPVVLSIISAVVIVVSALFFKWLFVNVEFTEKVVGIIFRIDDLNNIKVLILPLSYSLGTFVNAGLLWFFFQKDFNCFSPSLEKSFLQTLMASLVMGVFAYFSLNLWDDILDINTFRGIFFQGLLSGIIGLVVLTLILKLLKNQEIDEILLTLRRKFRSIKF